MLAEVPRGELRAFGDAIESEDTDGVDLAKVKEAQKAFEDGDLTQTELLLEQAVGACPG